MNDTTPTAVELEITTAARAEYAEHHRLPPPDSSAVDWDEVDRDLRAFSRPVVAAELRRFADTLDEWMTDDPDAVLPQPHTVRAVTARLRARADELDGA